MIMIDNQVKVLLVPQVEYDSSVTTFGNLLEFFWQNHDPNSAKACSRSLSSFLAVHNSSIGDLVPCLVGPLGTTNNQSLQNTTE